MTRFVDRGAITAAYVGIGMAVTIAISFLLIIPIEPIVWLLALPSGLLIGYYANQRSNRRAGPWGRILVNGVFAALVTGVTAAVLLLGVKALFFYADNGYRDASAGGPIACSSGAGVRVPALPARRGRRARARARGGRRDRRRLVHGVLLVAAVHGRGPDRGGHDGRWPGRGAALRRVPAEAGHARHAAATEHAADRRPDVRARRSRT